MSINWGHSWKEKEVMEKYEELEIEVIEFDAEDIITQSGDDDGEYMNG